MKTWDAVCKQCRQPFQYEADRARAGRVCGICQRKRRRRREVRKMEPYRLAPGEQAVDVAFAGLEQCGREEVAGACGISMMRVAQVERMALLKLRKHAELRECYARWVADGMPVPGSPRDAWDQWSEWKSAVTRWQQAQVEIAACPETQAEAAELGRQIESFQVVLAQAERRRPAEPA